MRSYAVRYVQMDRNLRSVAEALRPKDYSALNNPKTRDSKETLRRRAVRLAQRVRKLEEALEKVLAMEQVPGAEIPTFVDKAEAMTEARLALSNEPFWTERTK